MSAPLPHGDDVIEAPLDLAQAPADAGPGAVPLPVAVERWPLAPGQTERWLAAHLGRQARLALNESACLVLTGALDMDVIEAAILDVLQRHDAFRMHFGADEPWQALDPAARPALQRIDLRAHPDPSAALDEFCRQAVRHDFVLDQAPMARFSLLSLAQDTAAFHLVYSHLVCDGWSVRTIMSELAKAMRSRQAGQATSLRAASAPGPFATQLLQRWNGAEGQASAAYWRALMRQPPPPLDLGDLVPPAARCFGAGTWVAEVDADTLGRLQRIAQQHDATLFPVLLAAMAVALQRRSGREDFTIAIPFASQALVRGPAVVADGAIDLPLRVSCRAGEPFGAVLVRLRDRVAEALKHPFATQVSVARDVGARSLGNRPPLTGILCNMIPRLNARTFEPLHARAHEGSKPYLLGELLFNLLLDVDALTITLHYSTDFFSRDRAGVLVADLQAVLAEVASADATGEQDVDAPPAVAQAPTHPVPPDERATLARWNATAVPRDATLRVQDLIAAQSRRSPDAGALVGLDRGAIGYGELERQSNRLAHLLRGRGVGRGALVGLCVSRGPAMLVALLAVLKSGAAYVPLDPAYPAARLAFMAQDAQLALLVTDSAAGHAVDWPVARAICLDRDAALIGAQDERAPAVDPLLDATGDDVAYVIYTSGSTGQPKGVKVPHRAVVNFLLGMAVQPGLGPTDRLLAVTTLSFDIAVLELLLPLTVGAQVVIATREQAQDGAVLRRLLHDSGATVMQATPSTWRALLDAGWPGRAGFKALVGGEALAPDLAMALVNRGVELWNLYGPTETTVWSTCSKVTRPAGGIVIGTPIANTQVHVLDAEGRVCPIGVAGELWIGGAGVALGYLGRPALTAERFVPDSVSGAVAGTGATLYRTGDRGRWRADGQLEHLGRLDDQVKLRGHRIELGEVEAALTGHPGVAASVVRLREDTPGDQRLVAYVVSRGTMPSPTRLRDHLAARLPPYMLPQHFVALDALPLLPNGKTDRAALPAPSSPSRAGEATAGTAELRTATQDAVWQVWRDVLGIDGFGVHDNFFDLGGHSLLAMTLVSRLNARFDGAPTGALTLNAVLQAPTVALMAGLIGGEGANHDSLLALRAGGPQAPLFLVHDASGEALMYRSLALRLSSRMPVYALRPLATDGLAMVHTRIEDMAAHYVERIRSVQPHGPYRLGGLCSGGVVAFEVALQLQRAGERIELLALLDSPDAAVRPLPGRFVARRLRALVADVGGQSAPRQSLASLQAALVMARRVGELAMELMGTRVGMIRSYLAARQLRACLDTGRSPPPRLSRLTSPQIHLVAQAHYRNRERLQADAILFRATQGNGEAGDEPFVGLFRDPLLGWARSIAGSIECVDVPGGHFSMLAEPHVQSVATVLQTRLDAAPATKPAPTAG